jgi:hypothetical protein
MNARLGEAANLSAAAKEALEDRGKEAKLLGETCTDESNEFVIDNVDCEGASAGGSGEGRLVRLVTFSGDDGFIFLCETEKSVRNVEIHPRNRVKANEDLEVV